ncbi:MAG: fibronectin type III domain-containing protein [Bryobacteraceae bacterium]
MVLITAVLATAVSNGLLSATTVPPSSPGGLTATPASTTKVNLSWNPAVPGTLKVTSYYIYRGPSTSSLTQLAVVKGTSYIDQSASAGALLVYAVAAADSQGNLSSLSYATVNMPEPPSAPTGVAATVTSTTVAAISWTAASSGGLPVTHYQVFRGSSPATLVELATVALTSYTDRTLTAGTTYYYAVEAQDSGQDLSAMSATAEVTTDGPPSAPTGLTVSAISVTKANLSWNAAKSGGLPVDWYIVYRGNTASNLSQLTTVTKTSYTDTTLTAGATYYYALVAKDSAGDLSPVTPPVAFTALQPPSAPTGLAATPTSATNDGLTWNAAASGGLPVSWYLVFRGSSPSNLSQMATVTGTTYTDKTMTAGSTYYYGIEAKDSGSDISAMSSLALVTAPQPPAAPTGFNATGTSTTNANLSWNASVSGGLPVSWYLVFRGSSPSSLSQIGTVSGTTYTDRTMTAGSTYYYGIEAKDSGGDISAMTPPVAVTALQPPSAPTGIAATANSTTNAGLSWNASVSGGPPVNWYLIFRGSSPSSLSQIATVTGTSYIDTTMTAGNTYYYAVEAKDSGNDTSAMSSLATVTAPQPPAAPTAFTATANSSTNAGLSWNAATSGGLPVNWYLIFRGTSQSNLSQLAMITQTSYTDTSMTAGSTYYYAVQAKDCAGDTSAMSSLATVTAPQPPSAPTGLSAAATSATIASLSWNPAASGGLPVNWYTIFRGSSSSNLTQVGIVAQTSYTDTSASPGATYYYAVEAKDSGGDNSVMSSIVNMTTYCLPSAPTGLAGAAASTIAPGAPQASYSVNLSWNPATSGGLPISYYQVFRGSSPSNLSQVAAVGQNAYTDSSVSAGATYYYAIEAGDTANDISAMSGAVSVTALGGQAPGGLFNILPANINSFTPTQSNLPGLPSVQSPSGPLPAVGYQGGVVINGQVLYFPWQVPDGGGSSWTQHVADGIPHTVMLAYNATQGINGYANAANWTYFDLSTLNWYSEGGIQGDNALPNLPAGYLGAAVANDMVYLTPKGGNAGPNGGGGPYPVFVQYNSLKALNDPTAYQTFVPPPMGTTMGYTYGWCTAVFDGQFIYYAPLANQVTGNSGNIFRYDTTQPFSNLNTGGVTSAWENFDMFIGPGSPNGISANAEGFQAVVFDGYRYIYYIPFQQNVIVRYDTWNGGTQPDPTGFTIASNYVTFDPTQLGISGYPAVNGPGVTANLSGFTGATVVWDAANQNEYLYLVPWATYPDNATNPVLQTTVARVRIGTMSGSSWNAVDITSTATSPEDSTPNWEMFDLSLLTQNAAWPTSWPTLQNTPNFTGLSDLAGYQAAIAVTNNSTGSFAPRVMFVPDTSGYLVEHDVAHDLFDPTGWYVMEIPNTYSSGTMGGGYDAPNAILYPSSPNAPLFAFQF